MRLNHIADRVGMTPGEIREETASAEFVVAAATAIHRPRLALGLRDHAGASDPTLIMAAPGFDDCN